MRPLPTSFSVALGLCFILPLLSYVRDPPLGDFLGEWSSALVMALGALFMLRSLPRKLEVNGTLFAVPAVLAVLIVVQAVLGRYAYAFDPLMHFGYLGMLVLVLVLGQHFRSDGMAVEVARRMAWAMVLVGLVNVAAQVAQLGHWDLELQPWVVRLKGDVVCNVYGNTGQANQTSAIAWLAIMSSLYLAHERRMPGWLLPVFLLLFMLSSAATGSRMAWLFLGLTVAGLLFIRPRWAATIRGRLLLAGGIVAAFAAATGAAGALIATIEPGCQSTLARLAEGGAESGIVARLAFLQQALLVWAHDPLVGSGAGSFKAMAFQLAAGGPTQPNDIYAHNIVAQLLAEFGAIGAGSLLLVTGACFIAVWRHRSELGAADALLLGWLGILGIHSLLEYPLWYVHFLMFFGLSLGLLIRPQWRLLPLRVPVRWLAAGLSLAAVSACIALFVDYSNLGRLMFLVIQKVDNRIASSPYVDALLTEADDRVRIYRPHAEHMLGIAMSMSRDGLAEKIAATDRLMRRSPTPPTVARRAVLAVLDSDEATARRQLALLQQFFPRQAGELMDNMRKMAKERPEELGRLAALIDEAEAAAPPREQRTAQPKSG